MLKKLRARMTYANVTGTLALFVALGGTGAYAANEWNGSNIQDGTLTGADIEDLSLGLPDLGVDSVSTGKLKDQDVRTQDLRDLGVTNPKIAWDSVSSGKVIDNSLLGRDIRDGELADELFSRRIPGGITVRGMFGETPERGSTLFVAIGLPIRAPLIPTLRIGFSRGSTPADPACTGSFQEPTAPSGSLCVYRGQSANVGAASLAQGTRDGVVINVSPADFAQPTFIYGSWAYTAP
jgi:hypothetical protein